MNNNFDYIQLYLRNIYNMVQRDQRSIETYKQYKKYLTVFKKWEDINELISLMNKELQNRQISNNSKLTKRNIFKAFLSWYTKMNNFYMDYNSELVYIREEKGRRQAIPEKMLEILIDELKSYKNAKFSVLFRLFLSTGMRVGEFKIFVKNAHKLESENWSFIIQTLKNNKPRYIRVPSKYDMPLVGDLRRDLMKYLENLNLTTKSIKNMFCEFSKYIKQKYPNFKHQISAHILRHNFATKAFYNLGSNDLVAKLLGHTNSTITQKTYIDYDKNIMDQLAIAAVQDRKTYVSIVELKAINKSLGDKIVELEKDNKALREEIEKLKNEKNYCARK